MMPEQAVALPIADVRYVKDFYPRLRPVDALIDQYADALAVLPPIVVARGGIIVDGYHRWQAHLRAGAATIWAVDLGNLSDTEILTESIRRNATHGQQLSQADKKSIAARLWQDYAAFHNGERSQRIAEVLAVSERSVQAWTQEARQSEKQQLQDRAWGLWLDCQEQKAIAAQVGVDEATVSRWLQERKSAEMQPPDCRQHFDVWQFGQDERDARYFGKMPAQVVENLLWLYTEPGQIVVDPFAGSGTTIEVGKSMGRRVWASDRCSASFYPNLPIHTHNILEGWPKDAPRPDLVLLDPPYWQQAKGRYSDSADDLGNMALEEFYTNWRRVVVTCLAHLKPSGVLAYVISPTQLEDGAVEDHATEMLTACRELGCFVKRRIIVTYQTQQATGQQVTWARENRRLLKLYRDLVVLGRVSG